jgi:hypothetical protein
MGVLADAPPCVTASPRHEPSLPATIEDLPADLRAEYEERPAIAEFDGGLDRGAAERLAWAEVTGEDEP